MLYLPVKLMRIFCCIYCILSCIVSSEKVFWPLCELILVSKSVNPFILVLALSLKNLKNHLSDCSDFPKVYILAVLRKEVCLLENSVLDLPSQEKCFIVWKVFHFRMVLSKSICVQISVKRNCLVIFVQVLTMNLKNWASNSAF